MLQKFALRSVANVGIDRDIDMMVNDDDTSYMILRRSYTVREMEHSQAFAKKKFCQVALGGEEAQFISDKMDELEGFVEMTEVGMPTTMDMALGQSHMRLCKERNDSYIHIRQYWYDYRSETHKPSPSGVAFTTSEFYDFLQNWEKVEHHLGLSPPISRSPSSQDTQPMETAPAATATATSSKPTPTKPLQLKTTTPRGPKPAHYVDGPFTKEEAAELDGQIVTSSYFDDDDNDNVNVKGKSRPSLSKTATTPKKRRSFPRLVISDEEEEDEDDEEEEACQVRILPLGCATGKTPLIFHNGGGGGGGGGGKGPSPSKKSRGDDLAVATAGSRSPRVQGKKKSYKTQN